MTFSRGRIVFALCSLAALTAGIILIRAYPGRIAAFFYMPTPTALPRGSAQDSGARAPYTVVAGGLSIPWEIAFLPEGRMLATERTGALVEIFPNGRQRRFPVAGVVAEGEGGLLGMALHQKFLENHLLYLYETARKDGVLMNRVVRYRFEDDALAPDRVIVDNIPAAANHNGGRIAFGPDGYLYMTTGDAGRAASAQNTRSLAGKILRVRDDGSIPADNPFGNAVWSYGHRNPQGIAWDETGALWATEHGRSGTLSGYDELNRIEKGRNYGWPVIQGPETREGMESPVAQSGSDETWAPAGLAYRGGSFYFSGLRGQALYRAEKSGPASVALSLYFHTTFGRLRAAVFGSDGALYISTSNTDGRGTPAPDDDKIIRIDPAAIGIEQTR